MSSPYLTTEKLEKTKKEKPNLTYCKPGLGLQPLQ